jgi:rhamnosyltransferase subunit B
MARIALATIGSLGDLHPKIALGLELRRRGHDVVFSVMDFYREKIEMLGFEFHSMRPHFDVEDRELMIKLLDPAKGPENLIKNTLFPVLRETYHDLKAIVETADLFVSGEIVYAAPSVAEKTGVKWVTTSLAPISLFSSYDPNVYPMAEWLDNVRFMPVFFHQTLMSFMKWTMSGMLEPYKDFRREIGLDENTDPIISDKASDLLHLVMFSRVMAAPRPDWFPASLQTGFCFYDGQNDLGTMPDGLNEFLEAGGPPIVFTLGSAAVMEPGAFFEESVKAAKILDRRAVLLYGMYNEPPTGLNENIAGFPYAPYSRIFPHAACVVHQGGIGTTSQVLRAGIPMLVMPYAYDQPDNAARCRRFGVARTIGRFAYRAEAVAEELKFLLADNAYCVKAARAKAIVDSEGGTAAACDAIESVLQK